MMEHIERAMCIAAALGWLVVAILALDSGPALDCAPNHSGVTECYLDLEDERTREEWERIIHAVDSMKATDDGSDVIL